MPTHARFVIAPTLLTFSTALAAQIEVEPIHVTASRLPEPATITISVLDEGRIERQHSRDVLDLLLTEPGISATQPGGPGGFSEVFLRGAESNFTVVLIDGVRLNDSANSRGGGYDFSTLDALEIERIEIARGALSAVHGSDAMAGVINIDTRRPTSKPSLSLTVEGGEDDFQRASAALSGPIGAAVRGSLKAAYADFGDAVSGSTQRISSTQADLEFGSGDRGIGEVRTGVRHVQRDRKSFADASGGPLYSVIRDYERADADETSAWAHVTRTFSEQWSMDATASLFSRREDIFTPAIAPGVFEGVPATTSDSRFRRGQFSVTHRYTASPKFDIGGGIDVLVEDGEREGALDLGFAMLPSNFDLDRLGRAVFLEARYRAPLGIELHGAARLDDPDDDTARGSGRVAIGYTHAATGTRVHASWSNGHKQPSFYALGDTLVGNEDLRVEKSAALEVGVEQRLLEDKLIGALTAFRTKYEDLIDFDFASFRLVNRSEARIDGVEASLTARLTSALTARAYATLSDIELNAPEAVLLYRPEEYGGVEISWHTSVWSARAHARIVSKRAGSSVPTGPVTLAGYERVDLAFSRALTPHSQLFAALDNVLDEDYQEAVGFPNAGRQFRIGATVQF